MFEKINLKQFEQWVKQLVNGPGIRVIAIDGKGINGSYVHRTGSKALHLVSAWATQHQLVLAQTKVQNKSNEITAIPVRAESLDIQGCTVTLNAMGTQKQTADQIHISDTDCILTLKVNHPILFGQVESWVQKARTQGTLPLPSEHTTETGHHRTEICKVWVLGIEFLRMIVKSVLPMPFITQHRYVVLHSILSIERRLASYACGINQARQQHIMPIC